MREVVIGLIERNGRFAFLHKKSGVWTFPGGKVDEGETRTKALIREVKEETGLDVRVGCLLGTKVSEKKARFYFQCFDAGGELALTEPEIFDTAQWMTPAEILNVAGDGMQDFIREHLTERLPPPAPKLAAPAPGF